MDTTKTSGLVGGIELNTTIVGHSKIDFDKRLVKKALRRGGAQIRAAARRLVARKALSKPGEFPGKQTGVLQRSIRAKLSSGGFWLKVMPFMTPAMAGDFYPAYLHYGTKGLGRIQRLAPGLGVGKSNRRRRGQRAALEAERRGAGHVLEPRGNYMTEALQQKRDAVRVALREALENALIPR